MQEDPGTEMKSSIANTIIYRKEVEGAQMDTSEPLSRVSYKRVEHACV